VIGLRHFRYLFIVTVACLILRGEDMSIVYEKVVAEDLNLGVGSVTVTSPAGGTMTGSKINIRTFFPPLFYVDDYGAVGNGVANDTTAIQNAITALQAAGGGTLVFRPGATYYVSPALVDDDGTVKQTGLMFQVTTNMLVWGYGAKLVCHYGDWTDYNAYVFYPWANYNGEITLDAEQVAGATTISIPASPGTTGIARGDGILVISTDEKYYWYTGAATTYYKAFMTTVTQVVSGTSLRIADPLPYVMNEGAAYAVKLRYFTAPPRFAILGLNCEWTGTVLYQGDLNNYYPHELDGLMLWQFFHPMVRDIGLSNMAGYGAQFNRIYGGVIDNVYGEMARGVTGWGYGIGVYSNYNTDYNNCHIWASRHAVACSGLPSCDVRFNHCDFESQGWNDGYAWDSHIAHRVFVNDCNIPNGVKYAGAEHYFTNCRIGNKNVATVFYNRGTISTQLVFEVRHCPIECHVDGATAKYIYLAYSDHSTANHLGLANYGAIRFIDCPIENISLENITMFGGEWYVDTIDELMVDRCEFKNRNTAGTYGLFVLGYLTSGYTGTYHTSVTTPGMLSMKDNFFPYPSAIGTPTLDNAAVKFWDYER